MARATLPSIVLSLVAIVVCGAIGVAVGLGIVRWIGLDGTVGALTAAVIAMPVAGASFSLGVIVLKRLRAVR